MKQKIKSYLSSKNLLILRKFKKKIQSFFAFGNLNKLALIWGTDKWGSHWYTQHYHTHFKQIRHKKLNILEIGVGGYDDPKQGGNSLRTWKEYFPKSNIFAIDIYDKSQLEEKRIKIFKGSQVDKIFLDNVCNEIGKIDIIIDDGSHLNEHVIQSFKYLFPKLDENGIYVVEDLETAYWTAYGGDSVNLKNEKTSINFLKSLVDNLNHAELILPGYKASYLDLNIKGIHFYHNMVFIQKGKNDEKSVNIVNNSHHRLEI
jgi:hypothetical protein